MADETFAEKLIKELSDSGATTELLAFALMNVSLLQTLGAETIQQVVVLFESGKDQEAQLLLDSKMNPDQIIASENMNAEDLMVYTKNREKFVADLKSFGWKLLPTLIKIGVLI